MDFFHAILKGIIQGLTEFLPVSSTAHLIFTDTLARLFGGQIIDPSHKEEEFYDILLHLGTLSAVLFYFKNDLIQMVRTFFDSSKESQSIFLPGGIRLKSLPIFLIGSMVATVVVILSLLKGSEFLMKAMDWSTPQVKDIHEFYMAHPQFVAFHLIITGCLLFFTDRYSSKQQAISAESESSEENDELEESHSPKPHKHFLMKNALAIGFAQGCAGVFHGISRSGSTISAGLLSGLDRVTATRYSFLLSIPTFIMAAVYEAKNLTDVSFAEGLDWPAMLTGTALSAIVGYFCVKYFIQYVANHSLKGFAIYCWVIGITMFCILNYSDTSLVISP
ncbi:MAG: undecaprenyl-diphosphate phosphatase [Cyanobacteria bacterium]|nr:undecaprenyl-diphosphate phosphatase [Cyanobacteriota bacterium]